MQRKKHSHEAVNQIHLTTQNTSGPSSFECLLSLWQFLAIHFIVSYFQNLSQEVLKRTRVSPITQRGLDSGLYQFNL